MDQVQAKLARVREAVEAARSMPMSSSAVVNRTELLDMIDDLQREVVTAFGDAQRVMASRNDVVEEGRQQAEEIIRQAHLERDKLASDTDVFRLAQHQAEELLSEARSEAEALRAETDEYVDGKLANFEITLERTLDAVRRGRDRLAGRTVMDGLTAEEADKIVLPEHLGG
jgi:cell division septum initiation protein DivIVA